MNIRKQAFTLVELIVVITILSILWTIAFISMQWYSKSSRDSVRVSDMWNMKTSFELFHLNTWKYPETTSWTIITYENQTAWNQWKFWETTFTSVGKLDDIPTDPLTEQEYIYSVTNNKQEYQIWWIVESDDYVYNNIWITNAADKTAILKIEWNYNGKVLKVNANSVTYVLAVPSIITSTWWTLEYIIDNRKLAYNGYKNLPFNYGWWYTTTWETDDLLLVNTGSYVVFSWSLDEFVDNSTKQIELITNLQTAYINTDIAWEDWIEDIVLLSWWEEFLAQTFINNSINSKVKIINNPNGSGNTTTLYSELVTYMNENNLTIDWSFQKSLIEFNGKLYFYMSHWSWWDLKSIDLNWNVSTLDTNASDDSFVIYNNKLFFKWYSPSTTWVELLYIDTSNNVTTIDINSWTSSSYPEKLTVYNNKLYFTWNNWTDWTELMFVDTNDNVWIVDINISWNSNPDNLTIFNNKLYFEWNNWINWNEIMYIDFNNDISVIDLNPWSSSSWLNYLITYNDKLYFVWYNSTIWTEIMYIDSNNDNWFVDVKPGSSSSYPKYLTIYNDLLYFSWSNWIDWNELHYINWTNNLWVVNINSTTNNVWNSNSSELIVYNNDLYLNWYDWINWYEAIRVDSNNNTTTFDLNIGGDFFPEFFKIIDNKIYFIWNDWTNYVQYYFDTNWNSNLGELEVFIEEF